MESASARDGKSLAEPIEANPQQDVRDQGEEASFEVAYGRLEHIVKQLESGDISLAESLQLFEEGIALARQCAGQLDRAETTIRMLLEQQDGSVREVPLDEQSTV